MRYSDLAEVLLKLMGIYLVIVLVSMTILSMSFSYYDISFEMVISSLWTLLGAIFIGFILIVKSGWIVRKIFRIPDTPIDTSLTLSPEWYTMGLSLFAALNILRSFQFFVGRIIGELQMAESTPDEIPGFDPWYSLSNITSELLQLILAILLIAFAGRIGTFLYNLHNPIAPTNVEESTP